ncbi:PREDICTED: THO complex subunit 4C-like, partial [Camelina sativa]|uniref:THO complex subunit 4C-like n=1 Tax=Camelina sativa TaxID=90675 RepID=A0ABM0YX91_CAMSA
EIYAEIGELKRYAVHFDRNGRPNGSAEVVYMRRSDAMLAMKKYKNVLLDGWPMRLEILGGNTEAAPVAAWVNVIGLNGRMKWSVFIGQGVRGGRVGRGRGSGSSMRRPATQQNQHGGGRDGIRGRGRGAGGGRGNKNGRGRKKQVEKLAADLDKDLKSYHAEAMNIS